MRLLWTTDVHLNFVGKIRILQFMEEINDEKPDAILLGGDIGESNSVCSYLRVFQSFARAPVFFVLGNHDYYRGSVRETRKEVSRLCEDSDNLHWLNEVPFVPLTGDTALIGHDGWCDGYWGDFENSGVLLNDFLMIDELAGLRPQQRLETIRRFASEAAAHLRDGLGKALAEHDRVFCLTHVPPFKEASWHKGGISARDWLPFFTSKLAGDALSGVMEKERSKRLTVLCGHTHGSGRCEILPNLTVVTGGAEYRRPAIAGVFDIS